MSENTLRKAETALAKATEVFRKEIEASFDDAARRTAYEGVEAAKVQKLDAVALREFVTNHVQREMQTTIMNAVRTARAARPDPALPKALMNAILSDVAFTLMQRVLSDRLVYRKIISEVISNEMGKPRNFNS